MRTRDLVAERRAASEAMTRCDIAELVQHGVLSAAIEIFNMVGVARINRVADSCLYQPDQDEVWAFVTPVLVDDPAGPEFRCRRPLL